MQLIFMMIEMIIEYQLRFMNMTFERNMRHHINKTDEETAEDKRVTTTVVRLVTDIFNFEVGSGNNLKFRESYNIFFFLCRRPVKFAMKVQSVL